MHVRDWEDMLSVAETHGQVTHALYNSAIVPRKWFVVDSARDNGRVIEATSLQTQFHVLHQTPHKIYMHVLRNTAISIFPRLLIYEIVVLVG